jgi:beta-ureidopropionase / N-carbamoyl-L-amino-acid hydrolase
MLPAMTVTSNLPIDADRLWADVMALAEITDPARPYTRRSFTKLFLDGRTWLEHQFQDAGLTTRIDAAGNLIGRVEGRNPSLGTIAIGSHSDTVPSGGRFDGIAGVMAGLEIARALRAGVFLDHSLEIIDFLAEEPSEYGLSCVGSRGMTGALDERMLNLTEPGGETLGEAIRRVGGDPDSLQSARRTDIEAFLELHIEQGAVLESKSIDVGVVTSIVGIRRIEIVFEGQADHAGTTPLKLRQDALLAAARTALAVRRIAEWFDGKDGEYFVATVGILDVEPSASNVVPGRCRLVVDIRSTSQKLKDSFEEALEQESAEAAEEASVQRSAFTTLSDGPPVTCDGLLQSALRRAANRLGFEETAIPSGAGHDAAFMSRVCRSGMVFVQSRAGISHAPEEWTDKDALAMGASVLLEAVKSLDKDLQRG